MPTLLCSTSSPPQRPTASATIASQSALWVTSAAKASAWPFSARMSPTVSSARSFCTSTQSTRAPSRAMRIAVALPLPTPGPRAPAPVTIAIWPASRSPIGVESSWVLIMLSVRRVRLWSGLVLLAHVTTHLANHSLGLVSLDAMEAGRVYFLALWRNPVVSLLLYASLVTHVALAFWALYQRRTLRMPLWEAAQLALGLAIPPLLVTHIVGTRIAWQVYGVEDAYSRVALSLWALAPDLGSRQVLIVGLAWVHAMIGLHSIVKLRAWYPRAAPWLLGVVVLVPTLAILGFVNGARQTAALASDPAACASMRHGRSRRPPRRRAACCAASACRATSAWPVSCGRPPISRSRRSCPPRPAPPTAARTATRTAAASRRSSSSSPTFAASPGWQSIGCRTTSCSFSTDTSRRWAAPSSARAGWPTSTPATASWRFSGSTSDRRRGADRRWPRPARCGGASRRWATAWSPTCRSRSDSASASTPGRPSSAAWATRTPS